jgi:pectinesterase
MRFRVGLVIVLFLGGPWPASAQAPSAARVPDGIEVVRDLVYATYGDRELRLDLYLPAEAPPEGRPGVVVIRGGSWRAGDKEGFGPVAAGLAEHGFAAASIEYRTSSEAPFPAAIHDAKAALRWLRAHAGEHRLNPARIGAIGGSAGGHIAAYLGVTGDRPELEGDGGAPGESSRVQAVVVLSGALDLSISSEMSEGLWEAAEAFLGVSFDDDGGRWAFASPVTHVDDRSAPALLIHSQHDPVVHAEQVLRFAERYVAAGVPVELMLIPDAPHSLWNDAWLRESLDRAVPFLQRHLVDSP